MEYGDYRHIRRHRKPGQPVEEWNSFVVQQDEVGFHGGLHVASHW